MLKKYKKIQKKYKKQKKSRKWCGVLSMAEKGMKEGSSMRDERCLSYGYEKGFIYPNFTSGCR